MSLLIQRTNDALKVNPATGDPTHRLSVSGSDWLWAVTGIYLLTLLLFVGQAYFARSGEKIFNYLYTISLFVGGIAYFTIASDLGSTPIATSSNEGGTRQIFYAKYINWFVSWTPQIIALGLISGISWASILYNVALSWIWVSSWLSGSLVATHYKWGFFVFGFFAYALLSISLLHTGLTTSRRLSISTQYFALASWIIFLWGIYSIAWGLDDGGNQISVTHGFIFWGILDIFNIPVTSLLILGLSRKWDYRGLNLYFTQYGRVAQGGNAVEREKAVVPPVSAGAEAPVSAPEQQV